MKVSSWLQLPLIVVFGLLISLPFQNAAQNGEAHAEGLSRSIASVSDGVDTSCRVTVSECPKFPEHQGVMTETANGAHEIPLRCLDRAKHYAKTCRTASTDSISVRAEFLRNGKVLNETEVSAPVK